MSLPRLYRCVKPLTVGQYNETGDRMPGQHIRIEPEMRLIKMGTLSLADPPAVRLEGPDGLWIEIYPDTLAEHFEEV